MTIEEKLKHFEHFKDCFSYKFNAHSVILILSHLSKKIIVFVGYI